MTEGQKDLEFNLGCDLLGKVHLNPQELEWIRSISKDGTNDLLTIEKSELLYIGDKVNGPITYNHICYAKSSGDWFKLNFQYDGFPSPIILTTNKIDVKSCEESNFIIDLSFLSGRREMLWTHILGNLIGDISKYFNLNAKVIKPRKFLDIIEFSLWVSGGGNLSERERNYVLSRYILDSIRKYKDEYINKNFIRKFLLLPDIKSIEASCEYNIKGDIFYISYPL
jgi:hypothetical protein